MRKVRYLSGPDSGADFWSVGLLTQREVLDYWDGSINVAIQEDEIQFKVS